MQTAKPPESEARSASEIEDTVKGTIDIFYGNHVNSETNTPPIVTLCGSTSFKKEYRLANRFFTINGVMVFSVGGFHHIEDYKLTQEQKHYVDVLHFRKIDRSDFIFVINRGGYIGDSTENEIRHATKKGVPVYSLEGGI